MGKGADGKEPWKIVYEVECEVLMISTVFMYVVSAVLVESFATIVKHSGKDYVH